LVGRLTSIAFGLFDRACLDQSPEISAWVILSVLLIKISIDTVRCRRAGSPPASSSLGVSSQNTWPSFRRVTATERLVRTTNTFFGKLALRFPENNDER